MVAAHKKSVSQTVYIFVEASSKSNTEIAYFGLLNRKFKGKVNIQPLTKLSKLKKKVSKKSSDRYVAVLDGDIDYNDISNSLEARAQEIYKVAKESEIEVYLSNRCWENWLVLHFQKSFKPTFTTKDISIEGYEKKGIWYTKNEEYLMGSLDQAIEYSKQMRKEAYSNHDIQLDVEELPKLESIKEIKEILKLNPVTYVDILIESMKIE